MSATPTKYTRSVTSDFGGVFSADGLKKEIQDSPIVTALQRIDSDGDVVSIWFKDVLSSADPNDVATLNAVISAHTGTPPTKSVLVHLDGPAEPDGKPVFVTFPARQGWKTWFSGYSDDPNPVVPSTGRGGGSKILLEWTDVEARGEKSIELALVECIELHDGQGVCTGAWDVEDELTMALKIPASTWTPNGSSTGNANEVDTGMGYNILVPSLAGDTNVDTSVAFPVPAGGAGYWSCDYETGAMVPAEVPGQGDFHIMDLEICPHMIDRVPLGQGHGVLDVDVYKVEWIHKRWKIVVKVDKQSPGAGKFAAWLLCFRPGVTK